MCGACQLGPALLQTLDGYYPALPKQATIQNECQEPHGVLAAPAAKVRTSAGHRLSGLLTLTSASMFCPEMDARASSGRFPRRSPPLLLPISTAWLGTRQPISSLSLGMWVPLGKGQHFGQWRRCVKSPETLISQMESIQICFSLLVAFDLSYRLVLLKLNAATDGWKAVKELCRFSCATCCTDPEYECADLQPAQSKSHYGEVKPSHLHSQSSTGAK